MQKHVHGIIHSAVSIIISMEEQLIDQGNPFQLRYVLNQGEITTEINQKIAYEMLGSGLTEAREQLDTYKKMGNRFNVDH